MCSTLFGSLVPGVYYTLFQISGLDQLPEMIF